MEGNASLSSWESLRFHNCQKRCPRGGGHFARIGAVGATRTLNEVSLAGFVDPGPIRLDDDSLVVPLAGLEPAFRA